jgi:hypothetical protein
MDVCGNLHGDVSLMVRLINGGSNSWLTYSSEGADLGVKFVKSLVILSLVGVLLGS